MEESPVGVRHSAGIIDLKDWINPLHGYQYDSMNKDALLGQPFNYKALVVAPWLLLSREAKRRIAELRQQGVQIIDKPYTQTALEGVAPDVVLPEGVAYCHRQATDKDIYFLANQTGLVQCFEPTFRDSRQEAVLYHPVTDEYTAYDGTVRLEPYESVFVIFGQGQALPQVKGGVTPGKVEACLQQQMASLLWDVTFRESGVTLSGQQPSDWSLSKDDRIRYFSGHARYSGVLKLKKDEVPQGRTWLSFPDVRDIAHVWVNGQDCGIAWTAPYEVEISGTLQKGRNVREVEVVNTGHNALRGLDAGKAPFEGIWTNAKYRTKGDALLPAGMLKAPVLKVER
jgi:hypothetical protein